MIFPRLTLAGVFSAFGILLGALEPAGVLMVGLINAISYIFWAIWMVIAGVDLCRSKF